jgi:2C-methyl-D-erythritol 2,4-cyclodiphosphate synthase
MVGAASSSDVEAVTFLGRIAGWRGTNPDTRETTRARMMKLNFAIVMNMQLIIVTQSPKLATRVKKVRKYWISQDCLQLSF